MLERVLHQRLCLPHISNTATANLDTDPLLRVEIDPDKFTEPCGKFEPQFWRQTRCKTCFFTVAEHMRASSHLSSAYVLQLQ